MSFDREALKRQLAALVARNIFVGTSSWKYSGWCGLLYDESRYVWRGKFAQKRFEQQCLAEYAEVFKTVCVDSAYYRFPAQHDLERLVAQVPQDFLFSLKVTDDITIKKFTNLPRFGLRAGQPNANFLNADLFASAFLRPYEPFQRHIGLLIFEFSRFYPSDYEHGRDFVADLDQFLGNLPSAWRYGVEIRNQHFLHPDYFAALSRHGVAHIYNSWADMPTVSEQAQMAGSRTVSGLLGARFLLTPGRKYQAAVDLFSPYQEVKAADPEARAAGAALIRQASSTNGATHAFIYVNNRLEGNALLTIAAMLEAAGLAPGH
jgi:uncharacterized protein YecE (DUF72 family)